MINPLSTNEEPSIQESLLQLSTQLEHPLDLASVEQLYQNARDLLSHVSSTPVTLARVAGTLLVYHIQDPEGDELKCLSSCMPATKGISTVSANCQPIPSVAVKNLLLAARVSIYT